MPLHLKSSAQSGITGKPIFDPVGTNEYIKQELIKLNWKPNITIPNQYRFLGKDIDCGKSGILVEFQFSNYPFLLNNTLRSELFFQSKVKLANYETKLVIIITKAHLFPSSNSTLYYEQAINQLTALNKFKIFKVPMRLIGLFENINTSVSTIWTEYSGQRSREIITQEIRQCKIILNNSKKSIATINFLK